MTRPAPSSTMDVLARIMCCAARPGHSSATAPSLAAWQLLYLMLFFESFESFHTTRPPSRQPRPGIAVAQHSSNITDDDLTAWMPPRAEKPSQMSYSLLNAQGTACQQQRNRSSPVYAFADLMTSSLHYYCPCRDD